MVLIFPQVPVVFTQSTFQSAIHPENENAPFRKRRHLFRHRMS